MTKFLKKTVLLIFIFLLSISSFNFANNTISAAERMYSESELINRFLMMNEKNNSINFLLDGKNHYYRKTVTNIFKDENKVLALFVAAKLNNREIDEKRATEIILALMAQFDLSFYDALDTQNQYDSKKVFIEYAGDVKNFATSFMGGAGQASKKIETIIKISGLALDAADIVIETFEEYEVINKTLLNYERHILFLDAIEKKSQHKEMVSAAKKIKSITNQTMLDRIMQFNESGKKAVEFGVKDVFIDSIFTELVNDKTLELFKGEDYESALNGFVKGNEKIGELVGGVFGIAGGGVLIGDLLAGSTNNTNRIIEMYLLSDIYQCIFFEYMDKFSGASTLDLDLIMGSMPYLDMMTYIILRGEYCNSKIYEDSGIIGFLSFEKKEKTQSNYNKQVNFVTNSNSQLARLYKDIIAYLEHLSKNLEQVFFSGYYDGEYLYEIVDRSLMEFYIIRTNMETFEQEELFDLNAIGMLYPDYTRLDDYFYFMGLNGVYRVKIDGTDFQKIAEHGTIFGADLVWDQLLATTIIPG